ncbi:MAG: FAD:protein FMN transferase [Oscillospiraceae bacterium]|nr:FAD:protein FMN transferase [Oscillospiraceae bacterium]
MKKNPLFRLFTILLSICILFSFSSCGESDEKEVVIFAMDTQMTIKAYGKYREKGVAAASSIIYSMDSALDPKLTSSKVYELNHANGKEVLVSGQIAKMISTAQDVYKKSDGALDLTLYPLIKRWAIHDGKGYVPSDSEIYQDLSRLCFDQVVLTAFPASGSYTLQMPANAEISFAAVAKGCASDYAIEAMKNAGVESGIVSLGGNVQTLGLKPNGKKWEIAIQDPNNPSAYLGVLTIGETAVVTSGSYQRYFTDVNGKTYHHILKPNTGYPVNNMLSSVTVVCSDGTLADCLSTALFVLGETAAINYWRNYGKESFELIMVDIDKTVICTSGLIEQFNLTNTTDYTLKFIE